MAFNQKFQRWRRAAAAEIEVGNSAQELVGLVAG